MRTALKLSVVGGGGGGERVLIVSLYKLNLFTVFGVKLFLSQDKRFVIKRILYWLVVTDVSTVLLREGGYSSKIWVCMYARFLNRYTISDQNR